jgi:hypothetical protein
VNLSRTTLEKLLTKTEMDLVAGLTDDRIRSLSPPDLRDQLSRARRFRDKYQDLARRQAAEQRAKAAPRSSRPSLSNANTLRKVEVFRWAIDRLEARAAEPAASPSPDPVPEPETRSDALSLEDVKSQVVALLEDESVQTVYFGDIWAHLPDTPVYLLRKAIWSLAEEGTVHLTDDHGLELSSEGDIEEIEEVEAVEGSPRTRGGRTRGKKPDLEDQTSRGKRGDQRFAQTAHVRIHSHIRGEGRRNQAKRDSSRRR